MIPFGLRKEQFQARYRRCLERASQNLIEELRKLLSAAVPSSVKDAEVQIFLGEDGLETPTAWIYYRGENNKVDHSAPSIFPGRAMELSIGLENMEPFDERYFSDEEFNGLTLAANATKNWFAVCWWKAGGWSYAIPAKVWIHDGFGDGKAVELTENR